MKQERLSRRDFIKGSGLTASALLITPGFIAPNLTREAYAQTLPSLEKPTEVDPEFDWSSLHAILDELEELGFTSKITEPRKIREILKTLEKGYAPRLERIGTLTRLHQEQEKDPQKPSLTKLYQNRLAKIDPGYLNPEMIIPFYAEKNYLKYSFEQLKDVLGMVLENKKHNLPSGFGEIYLRYELTDQMEIFGPGPEGNLLGVCSNKVSIQIDPSITVTPEGQKYVDEDKESIGKFISTFRYHGSLCPNIYLYSAKYGVSSEVGNPYVLGYFVPAKNDIGEVVSIIWINMDEKPNFIPMPELIFSHEGIGHHGDVSLSPNYAYNLSPEEYLERLTFQMQILENEHWADLGFSIPKFFERRTDKVTDNNFVMDAPEIDTNEFVSIIKEYAKNVVVNNLYGIGVKMGNDVSSKLDLAVRKHFIENEEINKSIEEAFKRIGIDHKDYVSKGLSNNFTDTEDASITADGTVNQVYYESIDPNKRYESWDEFLGDFMPLAKKAAEKPGLRAKLTLWGLEHFQKEFGNFGFIWDLSRSHEFRYVPTEKRNQAYVYANYCNLVVAYMSLYHCVLNNVPEIRELIGEEDWSALSVHFYRTSRKALLELWADGVGYSHYIGPRLKEGKKCPFRESLHHLAWQLET